MNSAEIIEWIKRKVRDNEYLAKMHAVQRMNERGISPNDIKSALIECRLVEDYPDDKRGHSCLVWGKTGSGRDLHIVCGIANDVLWIITIYEPDKVEWDTPERRRQK